MRDLRKDMIIVLLFVALCCAIAGRNPAKQAAIEDTTLVHRTAAQDPQPPSMLFSPCPLMQRNFPRWQERKA